MSLPLCELNRGEAGQNALPIRSPLPSGGYQISYNLAEGSTVSVPHPPASFDPLTASAETLEEYGLPPRPPAGSAALAEWEEEMEHLGPQSNELCSSSTESFSEPGEEGSLFPEEEENEEGEASNGQADAWAGFVSTYFEDPEKFRAVEGNFVQPSTFTSSCRPNKVSSWVGLGGYNGAKGLMQAGVTVEYLGTILLWYEWLRGKDPKNIPPEPITQLEHVVEDADVIHVRVSYNSAKHKAFFYMNDWTQEKPGWMIVRKFNGAKWYNGKTAEWINERGSVGHKPLALKKFSPVHWFGARAEEGDGSLHAVGHLKHTHLVMKINSNPTMAQPSTLETPESFTTRFKRCSPTK
jgi:hypothetical protein